MLPFGEGAASLGEKVERTQGCLGCYATARQPLDRPLSTWNQRLGFPRIAQKFALPLQVGAGTRDFTGQAETPRQFIGLERRLSGLAFDPGQSLLGEALSGQELSQALRLLTPGADLRRPPRHDPRWA